MLQRNLIIDSTGGIAMLLVVLDHSFNSIGTYLILCLISFYTPLFFILSGLLAKEEIESSDKLRSIIQKK
jgi:fucose 4-O-acetylase-like acetyltransferase